VSAPRPRRAARLVLLLVSTGLSLLIAEVALRVAGVSNPNFYQPDVWRGWALRPGAEGWQRKEGEAWVHINSRGLRDEEHAVPKPAGELRIAFLGDSCTEAIQVPAEATFWALLEKELAASCPAVAGRRVQSLNFGVSGYGTAQELLTLRHAVWDYQPDAVVLAFYSGNDVRNNERPLEQDPGRPYFTLGSSAALTLDDSFRETGGYRLRRSLPGRLLYGMFNRSRLMQLGKQGKTAVDGWVGAWKARKQEKGAALQELGLDNAVYEPPDTPEWRDAWAVTEAMVKAMGDESAAHHVPFGVASLTTGMQVHPDPAVRQAFARKLGVPDLFYPDDRMRDFGAAQGIPVLTLGRPLRVYAERNQVFLHGFPNAELGEGHWNERGHAAAARAMAGWVCGLIRIPPKP
jgi:hypothetical protein